MFFLSITQFFLLMMILGVDIAGLHLGASPFRTLQEQMPNLPVWDKLTPILCRLMGVDERLARSPWIVIHPPFIFVGFAND